MNPQTVHILLADDDRDDAILFAEAMGEIAPSANLTVVSDGEKLMHALKTLDELPTFLVLDLNMPSKNGLECLTEIKQSSMLNVLPVMIYSTSFDVDVVKHLYDAGSTHYISKPSDYQQLKEIMRIVITTDFTGNTTQPARDNFVIHLKADDQL